VLTSGKELLAADRARLLGDVRAQIAELTNLVGDLVEAGRGSEPSGLAQDLRLDDLARAALARARPRADARGVRFVEALSPTLVVGVADRLERAMVNLLDNAMKFSPDGGIVEVGTADGAFVVRDHGPGIGPNDLPHVFERFYRSDAARGTPGSGLGLAIVRQVAETNGGTVEAANAPNGGAVFRLRLRPATGDGAAGHDDVAGTDLGRAGSSAQAMMNRKDGQATG
jgi:two-component system sensor histidine kinase MprB